MTPHYSDASVQLYAGDGLDVLRELPDASVDAVVTDPPAGIGFMGRDWDHHKGGREQWIAWLAEVMVEALRVIKPGGHALVWAMPRTSHWTATALEDAGWEIRDCITHLFGSGFPKSLDVSRAIDRAAGAEREVVGPRIRRGDTKPYPTNVSPDAVLGGGIVHQQTKGDHTAPATDAARQWQGFGTALKPASEHWWLARRPLAGTVAATVLEFGTGALNIDASRVGTDSTIRTQRGTTQAWEGGAFSGDRENGSTAGRWPPNVVLSGAAADELDTQSGQLTTNPGTYRRKQADTDGRSSFIVDPPAGHVTSKGDVGGASKFFPVFRYEPKAGSAERPRAEDVAHPTVKPLDLMRWLVRLVCPPGGVVLDPFAGSGTTAEACVIENFRCITIERDETYLPLIVARLTKPIQVGLDFGEGA